MSLFLSGLPLWITAILLVVIPTIIACCGLILVRRHVGLQRLTTNNEVAGFKFAVVGVIYAVLLGEERGPRLGSFIALYGIAETRDLIADALAGRLAPSSRNSGADA